MSRGKRKASQWNGNARSKKHRNQAQQQYGKEGSNEEVLLADVERLLAAQSLNNEASAEQRAYEPPEQFSEIEVKIEELSSTGDGLGVSKHSNHVYVVPFTAPGDVVKAKVVRYNEKERHTATDFVSVIKPSTLRDDNRIKCPYFAKCSGCQFQMMSYEEQLKHKKTVIERAYKNFSNLAPEQIPQIGDTIGSPLDYGYRTKLTPHFDGPVGGRRAKRDAGPPKWDGVPPIGFTQKGLRRTIDIEDCPIGTDAIRKGMKDERTRVAKEIHSYKRGATLLLRENTSRTPLDSTERAESDNKYTEVKTCVTDPNATTTEYVEDYIFTNPAGSFFQNNNSILPRFTEYIRSRILPSSPSISKKSITHLIDAYSGSGLFTITLSPLFTTSTGVDISPQSIAYASKNAELNGLSNTSFKAATASTIFDGLNVDPEETAVVIDPPRKGCDEQFLRLLLQLGPKRVVYVSCNVHTQARDVGVLVEGRISHGRDGTPRAESLEERVNEVNSKQSSDSAVQDATVMPGITRYRIESLQGFDFFPQTSHVESVAVLERLDQ